MAISIERSYTRKLQEMQRNIQKLTDSIDLLNARDAFSNQATQNIAAFNQNLREAADNLQQVALGFKEEKQAVEQYVQALGEANSARDRQNQLIKEQVRAQTEARAAQIAERTGAKTQYGSPIGPASAQEMDAVYASLDRLQQRAIDQANEFTEAIGRGTQEVYDLQAAAARVQGPELPVGFEAEKKAAEVRTRLAEDQSIKEINARRRVVREVLSEQIDADLQAAQQRLKSNDEVFKDLISKDDEYYRGWRSRLRDRTQESKKANKDIADAAKTRRAKTPSSRRSQQRRNRFCIPTFVRPRCRCCSWWRSWWFCRWFSWRSSRLRSFPDWHPDWRSY